MQNQIPIENRLSKGKFYDILHWKGTEGAFATHSVWEKTIGFKVKGKDDKEEASKRHHDETLKNIMHMMEKKQVKGKPPVVSCTRCGKRNFI